MTLEDLGNIGEFVAAIGVIISLLYVAVQIRQNNHHLSESNRSMRLSELNATAQSFSHFREMIVPHPEVAALLQRGAADVGGLDPAEAQRFSLLMQELFFASQNLFMRTEELLMPQASWQGTAKLLNGLLASPGTRAWWERERGIFDPRFIEALEREAAG